MACRTTEEGLSVQLPKSNCGLPCECGILKRNRACVGANMQQPMSTASQDNAVRIGLLIYSTLAWALPVTMLLLTWLASPTYVRGFFAAPTGLAVAVIFYGGHTAFCVLTALSGLMNWNSVARTIFAILAFISMLCCAMLPMVAPAVVTILQALGPVLSSGK